MQNLNDLQLVLSQYNTSYNRHFTNPATLETLIKNFTSHNITIEDWNTVVDAVRNNLELTPYVKDILDKIELCLSEVASMETAVVNKVDKTTIPNQVYATNKLGAQQTITVDNQTASARNIVQRSDTGKIYIGTLDTKYDATDAAPICYVDNAVKEASEDLTEAFTETANTKLDKVTVTDSLKRAYIVNEDGSQDILQVDMGRSGNTIVKRDSLGQVYVNLDPEVEIEATSKHYVDKKVSEAVASMYRFKGSVKTYANLPTEGMTVGDVYNVEDTGDNYAWTGTAWDALGRDTYTKTELDNKYIAAGFFNVSPYNSETGEITIDYSTDLYALEYDEHTGILKIEAK